MDISFISRNQFKKVISSDIKLEKKLQLFSDMCRLNTFSAVKFAGSGHLGSSLSSMEIFVALYLHELNVLSVGVDNPDRDIFFSSKGHDCPGLYSVLAGVGILSMEKLILLRRLGGLDGHPDVKIPGMETNAGSLGMGISKAKGFALAKKIKEQKGKVIVMTGDGELQEGQIWESLQTTAHQCVNNILVIVDHNKIQTDKRVSDIIDLVNLSEKFSNFGWHVERCDGHEISSLMEAFRKLDNIKDKPKVLIADTVKGKGVSFMEGETALKDGNGLYRWHSGAPDDDSFLIGYKEILEKVNSQFRLYGLGEVKTEILGSRDNQSVAKDMKEKVVRAYSEELVKIGEKRKDVVVLDADLAVDCGVRKFENLYPDRFIENGIAEQDMVSTAGGLALSGLLPIVNSFGVFLASRSNEQIYANATEGKKIIYVCHYAGLIPAGPGKSHQSLRDISLFGALPDCVIMEPCNEAETRHAINWCVDGSDKTYMMRLAITTSPGKIDLPENYSFSFGKGIVLKEGDDATIFAYGPVFLYEALRAHELLLKDNLNVKIINMPWLNYVDMDWIENTIGELDTVFVLDNHSSYGGLGDSLLNAVNCSSKLKNAKIVKCAVDGNPACGTPKEVLRFHGLDGESIADKVLKTISAKTAV